MIFVEPTSGLCNYLRVIFSYYEYANSINSELTIIWNKTNACNGYFLDYFKEIPNIIFLYEKPSNCIIYYNGCQPHPHFSPNYKYLELLPFMKELITTRLNIIGKIYISVHIRRTDHVNLAKIKKRYTTDEEFTTFIDKYENKNIYIATDNEGTYNKFKNKYINRVKFDYHKVNINLKRHTSLQDAIIDIYMCVYSEYFMGSGYSSFSSIINKLREDK